MGQPNTSIVSRMLIVLEAIDSDFGDARQLRPIVPSAWRIGNLELI